MLYELLWSFTQPEHYLLNLQHTHTHAYGISHQPFLYVYTLPHTNRVIPIIVMIVIFLAAFHQQQRSSSHLINQETRMSGSSEGTWACMYIQIQIHRSHERHTCVMYTSAPSCKSHTHKHTLLCTIGQLHGHTHSTSCTETPAAYRAVLIRNVHSHPIIIHVAYHYCKLACIIHHPHRYTSWCLCLEMIVINCIWRVFLVMVLSELLLIHSHAKHREIRTFYIRKEKSLQCFSEVKSWTNHLS